MSKLIFQRLLSSALITAVLIGSVPVLAAEVPPPQIDAQSCILMEASTGKVLYESEADKALPPASVTKVMTLLLIYDSVAAGRLKWDDKITVSEHAASMGGSQIFLEPNEVQSAEALTKSIAIASANDAAVAMAEHIGGSEEGFVAMMNERAKELSMTSAHFENACGLDSDNHLLSARDIALMSRELITKYPEIHKYTTTWQDTITHTTRKGSSEFGLTNTNKLIKWYDSATGLKTGSTSKAKYCLSATAKKDNMELIAVIMAAPDPKVRFREAIKLLDYGYAGYELKPCRKVGELCGELSVSKGKKQSVPLTVDYQANVLAKKGDKAEISEKAELPNQIQAPAAKGTKVGELVYMSGNTEVGRANLVLSEDCERAGVGDMLVYLLGQWI